MWLSFLLASTAALAHPESFSRSDITYGEGGLTISLRVQVQSLAEVIPALEQGITGTLPPGVLEGASEDVRGYLSEHYRVAALFEDDRRIDFAPEGWLAARVFPVEGPLNLPGGELVDIQVSWPAPEAEPLGLEVTVDLFLLTSPQHRDLCQLFWLDEEPAANLFHGDAPTWRWPPARPDPLRTLRSFGWLGLRELVASWPHLALLLLLVLGAKGLGGLVLRLGAFTLGELAGLPLGELEVLDAPLAGRLVELAFVLSVPYLAADLLLHGKGRRFVEPALFGLVHGLALHASIAGPLGGLYHQLLPLLGTWSGHALPILAVGGALWWLLQRLDETRDRRFVRLVAWLALVGGLVGFALETLPPLAE